MFAFSKGGGRKESRESALLINRITMCFQSSKPPRKKPQITLMQALRAEGASALSEFFLNQFGVLPMKHNLGQGRFG